MSDYENMTLEELKELKAKREKEELIAELTAQENAKIEAQKKAEYEELYNKVKEEVKNEYVQAASLKITPDAEMKKDTQPTNKYVDFLHRYTGNKKIMHYDNYIMGETGDLQSFNFDSPYDDDPSDTDCNVDVSSWSPADVYVNAIWHTMFESANLLKLAVPGLNVKAGDGMSVQIRTITRSDKDDITTTATPCDCISCTSTSFSTYTLTISQHGISREICDYDIWDVGEKYRTEYLKDLGQVWAEFFDWQVYSELETATAGYTCSIASTTWTCTRAMSGSCCSDSVLTSLYNCIDNVIVQMRSAYYKPDYIIMHPTVASIFRSMQTPTPIFGSGVKMGANGELESILGVKVVEYNAANTCTAGDAGGNEPVAIVIDSRRAVGAAFGKRPTLESDRNIDCNSTTYAMWCFFGAAELDTSAIGHVRISG